MTQVIPAIIPETKKQLEEEMNLVSGFAKVVQVDISDGVFTPVSTWPYNGKDNQFFEDLKSENVGWPKWEEMEIELHLMVENPEDVLENWIHTGISAVVVHVEAIKDMQKIIDQCRTFEVALGLAIKPKTDIESLAPYVNEVDFIQVMGSDSLGKHEVELEKNAVLMIQELHNLYPERIIGIDIGVTEESAEMLVRAGATKLISGSAILHSDNPERVFNYLKSIDGY